MKKISFSEMCDVFHKHNKENNVHDQFADENRLIGFIVYKSSNWPDKDYSLESRTYRTESDNKYFIPEMGGNSLFGDSLDGTDEYVRLDWQNWDIDYCYIKGDE